MKRLLLIAFLAPFCLFAQIKETYGIIDQTIVGVSLDDGSLTNLDTITEFNLSAIKDAIYVDDTLYFVNSPKPGRAALYKYSFDSKNATFVGNVNDGSSTVTALEGISYNPNNQLTYVSYGFGDPTETNKIGTLNLQTAEVSFISNLSLDPNSSQGFIGLLDMDDFVLINNEEALIRDGNNLESIFFKLNIVSGSATFVHSIDQPAGSMFLSENGNVITSLVNSRELIAIDTSDYSQEVIGISYDLGEYNDNFLRGLVSTNNPDFISTIPYNTYGIIDQTIVGVSLDDGSLTNLDAITEFNLSAIKDAIYVDDTLYFVNSPKPGRAALYKYSFDSKNATFVGNVNDGSSTVTALEGISYNPNNQLTYVSYGFGDPTETNKIGTLNLQTAEVSFISNLSLNPNSSQGFIGLLDMDDFVLINNEEALIRDGNNLESIFFKLNIVSGSATFVHSIDQPAGSMFLSENGNVIISLVNSRELIAIDTSGYSQEVIGISYDLGEYNDNFLRGLVSTNNPDFSPILSILNPYSDLGTNLELFPNPTNNNVYIDGESGTVLNVLNLKGQLVYSFTKKQNGFEKTEVSFLTPGIYHIVNRTTGSSNKLIIE